MNRILFAILLSIVLLGTTFSHGYSYQNFYQNMSSIDLQIIETRVIPINYWIREPGDFSDIIIIKFDISNIGSERFSIKKDMFRIDVLDPRLQERSDKELRYAELMIDNFFPEYSEDFKLRFQDTPFSHGFEECTLLNELLTANQTKTLHVCFDVRQLWNGEKLDLNGPKQYYLIMNDNKAATSCPNCKKIKLESTDDDNDHQVTETDFIPPLKQVRMRVVSDKVTCSSEKILVIKPDKVTPSCVFYDTAQKLVTRGWHISRSSN